MSSGWVDESQPTGAAWEGMAPGAALAAVLDGVDPNTLPDAARVSYLIAADRLAGWANLQSARAVSAVVAAVEDGWTDEDYLAESNSRREGWAADEVAAALRVAPRTATGRITVARSLVDRWPSLGAAVASGAFTWGQALAVAEALTTAEGVPLPDRHPAVGTGDVSDVVAARVLAAGLSALPPARLRERVAAMVIAVDPAAASRRRRAVARDRTDVSVWAEPDGMACLAARGPAPAAVAAGEAIRDAGAALRAAAAEAGADPRSRTAGQWRLAALLRALGVCDALATSDSSGSGDATGCGDPRSPGDSGPVDGADVPRDGDGHHRDGPHGAGAPGEGDGDGDVPRPARPEAVTRGARPVVRVTVDLLTLLGLAETPAHLDGYGPLDPALARALAADGDWVRWVTDPVTGYLLDEGSRRLPGSRLAGYIRARDARCSHPSCSARVRTDIDHVPAYRATGRTAATGLALGCPRHNRSRDAAGWSVVPAEPRHPDAGPEPVWISPLGRRYRTLPHQPMPLTPPPRPPEDLPPGWYPDDPTPPWPPDPEDTAGTCDGWPWPARPADAA